MADITQSPALAALYTATCAVEALGCGKEFTDAVVLCSNAMQEVDREVQRRIMAEAELERVKGERDAAHNALEAVGVLQIEGEWCYTSENGEQPADSLHDAVQRMANLIDRDALATARADALREARERVDRLPGWSLRVGLTEYGLDAVDRRDVLAAIGGEA